FTQLRSDPLSLEKLQKRLLGIESANHRVRLEHSPVFELDSAYAVIAENQTARASADHDAAAGLFDSSPQHRRELMRAAAHQRAVREPRQVDGSHEAHPTFVRLEPKHRDQIEQPRLDPRILETEGIEILKRRQLRDFGH